MIRRSGAESRASNCLQVASMLGMWPGAGPEDRGLAGAMVPVWRGPRENGTLRPMMAALADRCSPPGRWNVAGSGTSARAAALWLLLFLAMACRPSAVPMPAGPLVAGYLDRYFETYPTRGTEAGRPEFDGRLETLDRDQRSAWVAFNRAVSDSIVTILEAGPSPGDRVDLELLRRQVDRELFELVDQDRPGRDPLFWSTPLAGATLFLLLRGERPLAVRFAAATKRVGAIPGLAMTARVSLAGARSSDLVAEFATLAAGQVRSAAAFYRDGFVAAGASLSSAVVDSARVAGQGASRALDSLAVFFDSLALRATGDARLGADYPAVFTRETGIEDPVDSVLAQAERDLEITVTEAARYGRSVWDSVLPGVGQPSADREALRLLFAAVSGARDSVVAPYLAYWQSLVPALEAFVRAHDLATLPSDRTLVVGTAPAYLAGQSVGGVYGAGPFEPNAVTFLFVPVPGGSADRAERESFFADFNRPFTKMIAAHELIPGHYLQGRIANTKLGRNLRKQNNRMFDTFAQFSLDASDPATDVP